MTSSEEANTTLYIVLCEFEVANETYVIVPEDNRIIELDSLTPHTNYTCCVVANTTLGPSRQACVTQTTLESGELYSYCRCESLIISRLPTVPADPPGNVNVTAINSTAIEVEWSPSQTPNGIIDIVSLTNVYFLMCTCHTARGNDVIDRQLQAVPHV